MPDDPITVRCPYIRSSAAGTNYCGLAATEIQRVQKLAWQWQQVAEELGSHAPTVTRTRKLKLPVPTEHQEQVLLCQWAATQKVTHPELQYLFAVPNGARTSMSVAKRLKAEGLRKGYPDLGLDVARGGFHGLRLEMKRKNGVPSDASPEQCAWGAWLQTQGYAWHVCYGWEHARNTLLAYLALPPGILGEVHQELGTPGALTGPTEHPKISGRESGR